MCIAIVKPMGKTISKDVLQTCATNNPDGMGFAYVKDNVIYIEKYLKDFEKFYESYSKVEATSPMLIHFRIATHGGVTLENCHPFKMNKKMVLIHNGIISGYGDKEKKSDTRDFIDRVLSKISWKMWKNPAFIELLGSAIGYSKFGVMDTSGELYIVNETKGEWVDGVWYSNSSYKAKTYTTYPINKNKKENKQLPITTTTTTKSKDDDVKVVYKCSKCKQEFTDTGYKWSRRCPKCGSYLVQDVGWVEDGKTYHYDESWWEEYEGCYN